MEEQNNAGQNAFSPYTLREQAEQHGLSAVMARLQPRQTRMPFRQRMASLSLDELNLSVRSRNCLMRAGLRTFGDLNARMHQEGDVSHIRNLGVKSRLEILRVFRAECYARLNPAEKLDYWQRVLENDIVG